jgi:hypothetical protein
MFPLVFFSRILFDFPRRFRAVGKVGIAGIRDFRKVKCLHCHYAHYLAKPEQNNIVGKWVEELLSRKQ